MQCPECLSINVPLDELCDQCGCCPDCCACEPEDDEEAEDVA